MEGKFSHEDFPSCLKKLRLRIHNAHRCKGNNTNATFAIKRIKNDLYT